MGADERAALLQTLLDHDTGENKTSSSTEHSASSSFKADRQRAEQRGTSGQQPTVRVALFKRYPVNRLQVKAGSTCHTALGDLKGNIDLTRINGRRLVCESHAQGSIAVNSALYQGSIELVRHAGEWLAINQLPLETYVASVVGAEMPSHWNVEALKAQAVAARSYALVHVIRPASNTYHLGDSTRWQVYGGMASSSAATRHATQSTEGQVLQFRGGLVESLYAASAQISAEAHAHLGASMSQAGAQSLAAQGNNYTQILNRYYNGATLARIRLDGD